MSLDHAHLAPLGAASPDRPARPLAVVVGALAAGAWNLYGVVQLVASLHRTPESLVAMGMTPAQAATYAAYPAWMTLGFAVGAVGGLAGSALLLARRASAVPVFAASLIGYLVLYAGDATEGVFAALGAPQVAVLTIVVAVAAALLVWSRRLSRRGILRGGPVFRPVLTK